MKLPTWLAGRPPVTPEERQRQERAARLEREHRMRADAIAKRELAAEARVAAARAIEAERAARAGEYGSRRQGVHRPGAEPGGPTMSDGKK